MKKRRGWKGTEGGGRERGSERGSEREGEKELNIPELLSNVQFSIVAEEAASIETMGCSIV